MSGPGSGGNPGGDYRSLGLVLTAVTEIVAPTLAGVWLDDRLGWSPWGATAGAAVGLSVSIVHLVMVGRKS